MTRFDVAFAPLAVGVRSGFDESLYHGAAVAIGADGSIIASVGDPTVPIYPRSSLKPLQATAMVELGLALPDHLLAIVCASHDGAAPHLDAVSTVLDLFDLEVGDLRNTPSYPLDDATSLAARRAGVAASSLQQNCSGKHAGMLATCRINGWPVESYLASEHPLQVAITQSMERHGSRVHHVGVDGCGAPTHVLALDDLARSFAAIARSDSTVPASMVARPDLVGGPTRDVTIWMRAIPGLMAKDGADGVVGAALPDGRAFALKVASGHDGARRAAIAQGLRTLGLDVDRIAATAVARTRPVVFGHGCDVGSIVALEWTDRR
jgi:L-asparaginase II